MNSTNSITQAYNLAAADYTGQFWDEIQNKPMDQVMLDWFTRQITSESPILEIGGGPGEVSDYLSRNAMTCISTDRAGLMVKEGKKQFPYLHFEVQDFFHLPYAENTFKRVVAFYAIVNLQPDDIKNVFNEVKRVLKEDGLFLFTFHIFEEGKDKQMVRDRFMDKPGARLTFYFFKVEEIITLVEEAGFKIMDIVIRYPYPEVEYPSKRAYFFIRR